MLSRFLSSLDRKSFLNFHIWEFSYHSFFKEYARLFFYKAILSHPNMWSPTAEKKIRK